MKKVKLDKRVTELSATLPPLRDADRKWIDDNFENVWHSMGLNYYVIMERCKEFQVIRWYKKTSTRLFEFMQNWINENGEDVTMARKRFMRVDNWVESSPMRVKKFSKYVAYSYCGDMRDLGHSEIRVRSLLPALYRNGFRTSMHRLYSPYNLCKSLLTIPRIETLWKEHQYELVNYFYWKRKISDHMWKTIRVAVRHGMKFKDYNSVNTWIDTIGMMEKLGIDILNPKLICMDNIKSEHDKYLCKINKISLKEKKELEHRMMVERAKKDKKAQMQYYNARNRFFPMVITDGTITCRVLKNIDEFRKEADFMHHCVFASKYWSMESHPHSLILSAKIGSKRIETIEVNLISYKISQCFGKYDQFTIYHKRILDLVNKNMDTIKSYNRRRTKKLNKVAV